MGTITLQSPTVGQPNSTEDPKITSDFNVLQTLLNGNIDTNNLSPTAGITRGQLAAGASGLALTPTSVSVSATNGQLIEVIAGNPLTVTLPSPTINATVGVFTNAASGASPVSVAAPGGALIYGEGVAGLAFIVLGASGTLAILQADGTNWIIVGGQQDTGWEGITGATGMGQDGFFHTVSARLRGGDVALRGGMVASATFAPGATVATIPGGCRPVSLPVAFTAYSTVAGQYNPCGLTVSTAGALVFWGFPGGAGNLNSGDQIILDGCGYSQS